MAARAHAKRFCIWLLCFNFFLDFDWAPWNTYKNSPLADACGSESGLAVESNLTSGVKVLLASTGQTGTTTVTDCLRLLGFRTYHIEEQALFTRPALEAGATAEVWARHMSRCRVEAVALEPFTDMLPAAMAASPGAKVILTWRDYPSWQQSSSTGGGVKDIRWHFIMAMLLASSARMLPWIPLWDSLTGEVSRILLEGRPFSGAGEATISEMLVYYAFGRQGYARPENAVFWRGSNKIADGIPPTYPEEAYLAHIDEIRQAVPADHLLVFDVRRHGWGELTAFLGVVGPPASQPLSRPRSKQSFTNDTVWDHSSLQKRLAVLCTFLILHLFDYLVVTAACGACRRLRPGREGSACEGGTAAPRVPRSRGAHED